MMTNVKFKSEQQQFAERLGFLGQTVEDGQAKSSAVRNFTPVGSKGVDKIISRGD